MPLNVEDGGAGAISPPPLVYPEHGARDFHKARFKMCIHSPLLCDIASLYSATTNIPSFIAFCPLFKSVTSIFT